MPIEIKELVIKVSVGSGEQQGGGQQGAGDAEGEDQNEAIVKACVEKVMELINERMER